MRQQVKRYLSLFLVAAMLVSILPAGVFAQGAYEGETGDKTVVDVIESDTLAGAKNAVHGFVGVQNGGDLNLPLNGAKQFTPIPNVTVYFQWYEGGDPNKSFKYASPVYSAKSDENGQFHISVKPYLTADGELIKFDADTTVSAGNERYKLWIDDATIPEGYQLQYITGESVVFPRSGLPITQGGSSSSTTRNTHNNWKVLLMEKPLATMHKDPAKESDPKFNGGGHLWGKINWDYESDVGGVQWNKIANQTSPVKGVTVKASYLSDYAIRQIFSPATATALGVASPKAIRGSGWTPQLEKKLQDWIKKQIEKEGAEKWIAETVYAKTNATGEYTIQFKGTWGPVGNRKLLDFKTPPIKPTGWTKEKVERLGTVADKADSGIGTGFNSSILVPNKKHVNYDFMYVSTEGTENLRVLTPYNNNSFTQMNSVWGIHSGWSAAAFGVGVSNAIAQITRADFAFAPGEIEFEITNHNDTDKTAVPGDTAETSTKGLPPLYSGDKYRIVWKDEKGDIKKSGALQTVKADGTINSEPFDTKAIDKTTKFTAELYVVDQKGNEQLVAVDSFTVVVENIIGSMYEKYTADEPLYTLPKSTNGVTYTAVGLPQGLQMDGTKIYGTPTESGLFKVKIISSLDDKDAGLIIASLDKEILITDSPLKLGFKNVEYTQEVKPVEAEGYKFENIQVKLMDGKTAPGLTIGTPITGTPTEIIDASQEDPNVEVTYKVSKLNSRGTYDVIAETHTDRVPLEVIEAVYRVEYADQEGAVGEKVTIPAPTFKDLKTLEPLTEKPKGTFSFGEGISQEMLKRLSIDQNTGAITYTPTENDAGDRMEFPVVVTYENGSKDTTTAVLNVGKLDPVLDRSANTNVPIPEGYHRVTFKAGTGIDELTDTKVYDVRNGSSLKPEQYPGYNVTNLYENAAWSLEPGLMIVRDIEIVVSATKMPESELYLASYPDNYVKVGDTVKASPTFEALGGASAATGMKYAIPSDFVKPDNTTITVDANTGLVTFRTTNKELAGTMVSVPVTVTYKDNFYSEKPEELDKNFASIDYIYADIYIIEKADAYEPDYKIVDGTAGQTASISAPNFLDEAGKVAARPAVTFEFAENVPAGAKIDPKTGAITYPVPGNQEENIFIPVLVTYEDGSTDLVEAIVKLKNFMNEDYDPKGKDIEANIGDVLGDAEAKSAIENAEVQGTFPEGTLFHFKDIVNTATAGEKPAVVIVTYPDGTEDEVTINVAVKAPENTNAFDYEPSYTEVAGVAGQEATVDAPAFTKNGVAAETPTGTKFEVVPGYTPEGVVVDPDTGEVTYTVPRDAKENITFPIAVVYPDGSRESAFVTIKITPDETQPSVPTEAEAMYGDDKVKVTLPANTGETKLLEGDRVYITKKVADGDTPEIIGEYILTADDIAKLGNEAITVNVPIKGTETIVGLDEAVKPTYETYTQTVAGVKSEAKQVKLSEDTVAPNPPKVESAEGAFGSDEVVVTVPMNSLDRADTDLRVGDKIVITVPNDTDPDNPTQVGEYTLTQGDIDKIAVGDTDIAVKLDDGKTLDKDTNFNAHTKDKTGNMSKPEPVVVYPAAPELEVGGETATVSTPEYGDKITISIPNRDDVVAVKGEDGTWTVDGQPVTEEGGKLTIPLASYENRIPARETVTATVTDTANDLTSKPAEAIVKDTTAPAQPTGATGVDKDNKVKVTLPNHTGEDTDILNGDKVIITIPGENGAEDQVIGEYTLTLEDYYNLKAGDLEVEITLTEPNALDKAKTYKAHTVDDKGNASKALGVDVTDDVNTTPVGQKTTLGGMSKDDPSIKIGNVDPNADKITVKVGDTEITLTKDGEGNWTSDNTEYPVTKDGEGNLVVTPAESVRDSIEDKEVVATASNTNDPTKKEVSSDSGKYNIKDDANTTPVAQKPTLGGMSKDDPTIKISNVDPNADKITLKVGDTEITLSKDSEGNWTSSDATNYPVTKDESGNLVVTPSDTVKPEIEDKDVVATATNTNDPTKKEVSSDSGKYNIKDDANTTPVSQKPTLGGMSKDDPSIEISNVDPNADKITLTVGETTVTLTKDGEGNWTSSDATNYPVTKDGEGNLVVTPAESVRDSIEDKEVVATASNTKDPTNKEVASDKGIYNIKDDANTTPVSQKPTLGGMSKDDPSIEISNVDPNADKITLTVGETTVTLTKDSEGNWRSSDAANYPVEKDESGNLVITPAESVRESIEDKTVVATATNTNDSENTEIASDEGIYNIKDDANTTPVSQTPTLSGMSKDDPSIEIGNVDPNADKITLTVGETTVTLTKDGEGNWTSSDATNYPATKDESGNLVVTPSDTVKPEIEDKDVVATATNTNDPTKKEVSSDSGKYNIKDDANTTPVSQKPTLGGMSKDDPSIEIGNVDPNADKITLTVGETTVTLTKDGEGNWTSSDATNYPVTKDESGNLVVTPSDTVKPEIEDKEVVATASNTNDPTKKEVSSDSGKYNIKDDVNTTPVAPTVQPITVGDKVIKVKEDADIVQITVTLPGGTTLNASLDGSGWVGDDGTTKLERETISGETYLIFKVPDSVVLAAKDKVIVTNTDNENNTADTVVTVTDGTTPSAPTITNGKAENQAGKDMTIVSGKTSPNTDVTVTYKDADGKDQTVKGTSDGDGNFTIDIPKQDPETKITVTPKDGDSTDLTVEDKGQKPPVEDKKSKEPSVNKVYPGDRVIKGSGEAGASIKVTLPDGTTETTRVDRHGKWSIDLKKAAKPGDDFYVRQIEEGKKASDRVHILVGNYDRDNKYVGSATWTEDTKASEAQIQGIHFAYIKGYVDGSVKPEGFITRAESAQIIARLKGLSLTDHSAPKFSDTPSAWYNEAINAVVKAGIMKGYPDGRFGPNDRITRAEFAQMIMPIDKSNSAVAPFADVKGHWAENAINQAYGNGRIKGYPDGSFKPNAHITRAEAVIICNNLFDRNVDAKGLDMKLKNVKDLKHFTDLNRSYWAYYEMMEAANSHGYERRSKGHIVENWIEILK